MRAQGKLEEYQAARQRRSLTATCPTNVLNKADTYRTIFQQEWWLDSATNGQYGEVSVRADNSLLGWLPYVTRRRWGYLVSEMPFLTHTLGPVVAPGTGNPTNEFLRSNSIVRELLGKLPKLAHFRQILSPHDPNTLGFIEFGCHVKVQFTFISDCTDLDVVWKNMRDKTRNLIRRAEEKNAVVADVDVDEFLRVYSENCCERGIANHYDDPRTERILIQSVARDQGRIYLARNRITGAADAGIAVVWDSRCMYFLMSTRKTSAHSGAVSQLLWNAIQEAHRRRISFDFDGASSMGTYKFMSGFGAMPARRHVVERFDPVYHALDKMRASFLGKMENPFGA